MPTLSTMYLTLRCTLDNGKITIFKGDQGLEGHCFLYSLKTSTSDKLMQRELYPTCGEFTFLEE